MTIDEAKAGFDKENFMLHHAKRRLSYCTGERINWPLYRLLEHDCFDAQARLRAAQMASPMDLVTIHYWVQITSFAEAARLAILSLCDFCEAPNEAFERPE